MIFKLFYLILGIAILYIGADALVRSSVRLAQVMHIRPFIIGLTIISLISSVPELCISLISLSKHETEIMLGNIIGSNIANAALIIGVANLIRPLKPSRSILSRDIIVMYIATLIFFLFTLNASLNRFEGLILLSGIILYNISLIHSSKVKKHQSLSHIEIARFYLKSSYNNRKCIFLATTGVIGLIYGAHLIIDSAVDIAIFLGVNNLVISISVVSFATALPELGMAIVSSIRNQSDLLLGNIIGSNIYNLFFVTGLSVTIFPIQQLEYKIYFQLAAMIIFSALILLFSNPSFRFPRAAALLVLSAYFAFIGFLYL